MQSLRQPEKHICLNALSAVMGGSITVVRNLAGRIAADKPEWHFTLYYAHPDAAPENPPPNLSLRYKGRLRGVVRRWAWEQACLPLELRRERFDLMLCIGGYTCFATEVPQVSVWQNPNTLTRLPIHRRWQTEAYIALQRRLQALSMRKTRYNIFQTWDSVGMAESRWPMERYPHTAIQWGVDARRWAESEPPPLGDRDPFVLAVGHTYYHKNYEAMIDAIAAYRERFQSDLELRIVGEAFEESHYRSLIDRAERLGVGSLVKFLGALPPGDVVKLYRSASAYVVTSLLETFGLTTLEAMGNGLPVVAGRATCMPEVCGDAALYCDPNQPADIAEKLHAACHDRMLAEELRERGLERVHEFGWDRTSQAFLHVLRGVEAAGAAPAAPARVEAIEYRAAA